MHMIVITGATGHTGKVVAEALLAAGEKVRVVGRDAARLQPFVQNGAEAVVGSADRADSIEKALEGATAAFLMIPPTMEKPSFRAFQDQVSDAYTAAVTQSRVPYVVTLSSIGADQSEKVGPVVGLHNLEQKMNRIAGLHVLHLRPVGFMENLFMSSEPLKSMGMLPGPVPGEIPLPMIATKDIGKYAAERLHARDFSGSSIQELHGQRDVSMREVASIVGNAIGKPKLSYMQVPFMMLEPAMVQNGMSKDIAALLVEMWKAANSGVMKPQEPRNARNTTATSIETFVREVFAPAYLAMAAKA
jgi:uncharacterized protein YbjT (DUF2867 family)